MVPCWYCSGEHLARDCSLMQSHNLDLRAAAERRSEPLTPVVEVIDFPIAKAEAVRAAAERRRELAASTLDGFDFNAAINRTWDSRTRLPI